MNEITFTPDQLNQLPQSLLVQLYLQLLQNFQDLSKQNQRIQEQNDLLMKQLINLQDQIASLNQRTFGRKTETNDANYQQLSFDMEGHCVLNEAEAVTDQLPAEEPVFDIVIRKKTAGTRDKNLKDIEVEVIEHTCSEAELREKFPGGWHEVKDEVYKELQFIPATFKVLEHHVKVYAGNTSEDGLCRAKAPRRLFAHSILTPELAAAVFNAKYGNAVPLNRLSQEFSRNGVNIPRQDMAGWMIRLAERYLQPVHTRMKEMILDSDYVHCDETPFIMPEHSKQYMWVFHSPGGKNAHQVYLYEYLGARNGQVLEEFLMGYQGTLITDGYQPYHSLMDHQTTIRVAGCWAHARRKFMDLVKGIRKGSKATPAQTIACEAVKRIDTMYHLDNSYKNSSSEERLDNRKQSIRPLVDDYFAWLKELQSRSISNDKLKKAIGYSINQEEYLRVFLEDAEVPLDNNDAERSIRTFCVGKKNWHIIDSKQGANSSALLYSISETAKANGLRPYFYFAHLLRELSKYPQEGAFEISAEELEKLMPWSSDLPDCCRIPKK